MYEVGDVADTKCHSNFLTVSCPFFLSAASCHVLVDTNHRLHHFLLSMISSFSCFLSLILLFLYLYFCYFRVYVLCCLNMLSIFAWICFSSQPNPNLISLSSLLWVHYILFLVSVVKVFHRSGALSVQSHLYVRVTLRQLYVRVFSELCTPHYWWPVWYLWGGVCRGCHRGNAVGLSTKQTTCRVQVWWQRKYSSWLSWWWTVYLQGWYHVLMCAVKRCVQGSHKYYLGIKYSFVVYSFLHGCNCQPCPLCNIIKQHHFNWELSATCVTCKTLSVCRLYFPVLHYCWIFPILSQNFSSAGWVFCLCQVWQIWGYSMHLFWPPGGCIVSLFYN